MALALCSSFLATTLLLGLFLTGHPSARAGDRRRRADLESSTGA